MKKFTVSLILVFSYYSNLLAQPDFSKNLSLRRNIEYDQNTSLCFDLYSPGGANLPSGIGVIDSVKNNSIKQNKTTKATPVIIWIPANEKENFPIPVASYVGNGFSVISLQYHNNQDIVKNISGLIKFLVSSVDSFAIDFQKIGILQPGSKGYISVIWNEKLAKCESLLKAELKLEIPISDDEDFRQLQSTENSKKIITFFDKHLRNGFHNESDPLLLSSPVDSWIDPITNVIPGTQYKLFPTPSRYANSQGSYLIYLPKDNSSSKKRYPVIYWLHGGNGNSREGLWMCEQMDNAMRNGTMPQTIVVFVQGLPIGWYNNSVNGKMPVEDVIIKDLVPHIDATYRTINKREARALEGMSMGGYGSLHLGFKYPELFGVISSIAPSITSFEMERKEVIEPTFENDSAYFNANKPQTLVQKNADYIRKKMVIRILLGDKDFLFDILEKFHQQIQGLQIEHQYSIAKDAGHDYRDVIKKLDFNPFEFWKEAFKNQ